MLSKEMLLKEFISNKNIIIKIKGNNSKVIQYYSIKNGYIFNEDKVINDFIKSEFYHLLKDTKEELSTDDIKKWSNDIKKYELCEYVDLLLDTYIDNLRKSYKYFEYHIEKYKCYNEGDIYDCIRKGQYYGYLELFYNIRNEFTHFLQNKVN